jgi:hypothetical protein
MLVLVLCSANPRKRMDYVKPEIMDYGDLAELTAGLTDGDFTDAAFPVNTPKRDLTFSTP